MCSVLKQILTYFSGLKTFESLETSTKEPQEEAAEPKAQEEQKGKSQCLSNKYFLCVM